ncbi:DMT family transporter [Vibrio sp. SS-MA-C1-2]|uniref:DMT family transporter n=1 Tax=Vibrio sp. SS-MA-C1-2 TaxID=2908646 RepID=UPI001F3E6F2C|nr:DMT family transporter [Vibrio sp. SS-MA-C1-2]UJF16823.1 DMT family transporter [Vibrio sp. SS-MA-C1-2]
MFYFLPIIAVAIWSGNAIINIMASSIIEPGAIAFYRWFFAVLVLTPFCAYSCWKARHKIRPYLTKLAFLALLGMVLNQSLGYFAAQTTTATNMALLTSLVPLVSMIFSIFLLKQKLTKSAMIGAVLSILGVVLMLSKGDLHSLISHGISVGDGMILIATTVYALYCVLLKRWDIPLSTWQLVYMQGFIALIMLVPMLWYSEHHVLPQSSIPLVLYAALLGSVVAPWCWMKAVKVLGADKTATFMNLMPILTAIIAFIVLGEELSSYHYAGGLLVLTGVALAQKRRKNKLSVLTADIDFEMLALKHKRNVN